MDENRELAKKVLKRGYFTQFPFPENYDTEYVNLWRNVLDMALVDMLRGPDVYTKYAEDIEEGLTWANLISWLNPKNSDFIEVCEHAKIDTHLVYDNFQNIVYKGIHPTYKREKLND